MTMQPLALPVGAGIDPPGPNAPTVTMSPADTKVVAADAATWRARLHAALMPDYNRNAAVYWWAMVGLGGATLLGSAIAVAALPEAVLVQVLVGCVTAMLAAMFPVRIPGSKSSFAAGEIFIFLLLLMHGPAAAALAAAGEALVGSARTSRRWTSRLASPAMAAIAMATTGTALRSTLDAAQSLGAFNAAALMLVVMVFAIAYFLLNTLLVTLVVHLKKGEPLRLGEFFDSFGWVGITYAASSLIAALLYLTFKQVGISVLLAALPIIAMLLSTLHYHFRQRESNEAAQRVRVEAAEREVAQAAQHARALGDSERRFHSAFSHAAIGMALVAPDGQVLQVNPALCNLLGRAEADVLGRRIAGFVHPDDVDTLTHRLLNIDDQAGVDTAVELRCRQPQGREVWLAMHSGYFSEREASAPCLILQAQDITARRDAELRLHHSAFHDSLTSLANRARFAERVAGAIERCRADPLHRFAVMYLDFDRFKLINDTLGHGAGDQFLVTVASRIRHQVRPHDTVGRLGGDEFAILIEDRDAEQVAVTMAERLQHALRAPCTIAGTEISSSASIGITCSSTGYATPDEVLRDADIAMYRAKAAGRARYALFDARLRAEIADQLHLETDLRRAIETDQIDLAYQPIHDLHTGKIVSYEALARWRHPGRGPIAPEIFIPIAEESGLIGALTDRMLTRACRQLKAWQRRAGHHAAIGMHVNVSGTDLCRASLISHVTSTLLANGLQPSQLTLEITETTLMKSLDVALETMNRLRQIGVGLSVDDFGTGYSSLSSLTTLPITSLKIDRSFVQGLHDGGQNSDIVQAIVTLGDALGKSVIAEGVETPAQLAHLRKLGCGFAQGFLLACPLSADVAEVLLDRGAPISDLAQLPSPVPASIADGELTIH